MAAGPSCHGHSQHWPHTELWVFALLSNVPEKSTSLHQLVQIEGPVPCELLPGQILAINVVILFLQLRTKLVKDGSLLSQVLPFTSHLQVHRNRSVWCLDLSVAL